MFFLFSKKTRLLWQINKMSACQERFVKNMIRHKLVVAIDGLSGQNQPKNHATTSSSYPMDSMTK
jgi:hypothetical protein